MRIDELAFFNQQLGLMLKQGVPLEGALRQLAVGLRDAGLRAELLRLEAALGRGTPLPQALEASNLPAFYKQMVQIGARSNDLPGMLQMLGDHYQRVNLLWTRLQGLMVYPLIVIVVSLGLTTLLTVVFSHLLSENFGFLVPNTARLIGVMWLSPAILAVVAVGVFLMLMMPRSRARLRWRLPAFREASLAQLASTIALMLRGGTTLAEALAFAETLESGTPAGATLGRWRAQVYAGEGKPSQWGADTGPFPPLFMWLVRQRGEDAAGGFQNAADLYQARAVHRSELLLYCVLPISVLLLGQLVFWQIAPVIQTMVQFMNAVGGS
jgi:type II secretory pathway component PulF